MSIVSDEQRFLFDLQGFLLLREVLSPDECAAFLDVIERLKTQNFDDAWMKNLPPTPKPSPTYEKNQGAIRFNGLPRLDPIFDSLIAHPRVLPFLQEFMGEPQLVNSWAIQKTRDTQLGIWHAGLDPTNYSFRDGTIRTRMLNVVFFLTDNGECDGCMAAVPGTHKANFGINWQSYKDLEAPGSVPVTGEAGDVFLFSESVMHNGLPKTSSAPRTNLYFNYGTRDFNVMTFSPEHNHHFAMPPSIRARFSPEQKAVTSWMEFAQADE